MLYSDISPNFNQTSRALVFLHGLLGSSSDWHAVRTELADMPSIALDLSGHGLSDLDPCDDFKECCAQISQALNEHLAPNQPIILIGYSMGARIAMHGVAKGLFTALNIQSLLVEGGNFGLTETQQKQQRWQNDRLWAERFRREPIEQVLQDWYQQAVFASLDEKQRQAVIAKRSTNNGKAVAAMLEATSLAKQDNLLPDLQHSAMNIHYICGEKDHKFCQLAKQSGLSFSQVTQAGHNAHSEQPSAFAKIIRAQLARPLG